MTTTAGLYSSTLDKLTRELTGFDTFAQMLNAGGDYRPTILPQPDDRRYEMLADAYDGEQEYRGDPRRAYRGQRPHSPAVLSVRFRGVPAGSGLTPDWLEAIWAVNRAVPHTFGEPVAFYYGNGGWTEEYPRFHVVVGIGDNVDATITAFDDFAAELLRQAIETAGLEVLS
jgi:hypothetical protein